MTAAPPVLAMPPRPARPLPPLALLRTAAANTLGMLDEALFEEPVVVRRYGPFAVAYVSDPAGIRQVLIDKFEDYPRLPVIRRLYAAELGTGTLGTLGLPGDLWARHRRVVAPTLDRRALAPDLPELAAGAEALAGHLGADYAGTVTDMEIRVTEIWMLLLNRMVTGSDPDGLPILSWLGKVPRRPRLLDLMPMPGALRDLVSSARQSPERARLRQRLHGMIAARRTADYAGPRDFLWRVAQARDRETGETLPLDEARDEAASQLAAGEASIRALTWIWYLLALHPRVEARMHAELDAVLGERPLTVEAMRGLVYTRQVLDEVIRLYPPIPMIVRQARRADVIGGLAVPRRAVVIVAPWLVHRHRRLWAAPDTFDPDRFDAARSRERPRFAYIPFSGGPATCTGAAYATAQMTIVVAALARRHRFRLASDAPLAPVSGISLRPEGGLPMRVERR